MIYIFEFDIVPGKTDEVFDFMKAEGAPFWTQFEEVDKYEVFMKLGGSPLYEGHVYFKSFEDFDKVRSHPDFGKVAKKTAAYAVNMQRRFLMEQVTYESTKRRRPRIVPGPASWRVGKLLSRGGESLRFPHAHENGAFTAVPHKCKPPSYG